MNVCVCALGSGAWVVVFLGTRCHLGSSLGLEDSCVSWMEGPDSPASLPSLLLGWAVDFALLNAEALEPPQQPVALGAPVTPVDSLGWCPFE